MADVFISYARNDRDRIVPIVQHLEADGYFVWYDASLEAGGQFSDEIMRELDSAKCVIIVWSKSSAKSTWAYAEAEIARERNILIPVRIDDCRLPPPFNAIETIDLRYWKGHDADVQWDRVLAKVHDLCRGGRMERRIRSMSRLQSRGTFRPRRTGWFVTAFVLAVLTLLAVLNWEQTQRIAANLCRAAGLCEQGAGPGPMPEDWAREYVRIIGSSTIAPFAQEVARVYAEKTGARRPLIQQTGTMIGLETFCAGLGDDTPDIALASVRQTKRQFDDCRRHGVRDIVEVRIGHDAIVLAALPSADPFGLTLRDMFLAVSASVPVTDEDGECRFERNTARQWSDIRPDLPSTDIVVFGPPSTSGTRTVFVDLALEEGALTLPCLRALKADDLAQFRQRVRTIRDDGVWRNTGENDQITVTQVLNTDDALGIIGFSTFVKNRERLAAKTMNGEWPDVNAIATGRYPLSRSLFMYIKKQHVSALPAIREYALAFVAEEAWGPNGYLAEIGFIPLNSSDRRRYRRVVENLTVYRHEGALMGTNTP